MAPLINKEIDSFLGGVSQQPPETRLDSQVEESLNSLLDTTSGAMKRPPLLYKANINSTTMRETNTHIIDRDENENYIVNVEKGVAGVSNTTLKVLDASTGSEINIIDVRKNDKRLNFLVVDSWLNGTGATSDALIQVSGHRDNQNPETNEFGLLSESLTVEDTITFSGTGEAFLDGNTFNIGTVNDFSSTFTLAGTTVGNPGPGAGGASFVGSIVEIVTQWYNVKGWGGGAGSDVTIQLNDTETLDETIAPGYPGTNTIVINGTGEVTIDGITFTVENLGSGILRLHGTTAHAFVSSFFTPLVGNITHVNGVAVVADLPSNYISDVGTPNKSIRMLTIADSTFVVNRLKTVAMGGSPPAVPKDRVCISCSGGGALTASGQVFAETAVSGSDADEPKALEGVRWSNPIPPAIVSAITPGNTSNDKQSLQQIHVTLVALAHYEEIFTGSSPYNGQTLFHPIELYWEELTLAQNNLNAPHFRGNTGWDWFSPGLPPNSIPGTIASDEAQSNFIIGEYTKGDNVHPASVGGGITPVTVPDRERIDFNKGADSLVVVHNWNGPSDVSKLPAKCVDGFVTKIVGDAEVEADEYYLKFSEKDSAWIESLAEATTDNTPLDSSFDVYTMPHVLKRRVATNDFHEDHFQNLAEGVIYFTFGPENWASRTVGDEVMSPEPSFVGQNLNDVVLYKDRLTLLSRDSAVFSEVREPLNFWPTSIMAFVDSDPIDVQAATTTDGVSNFHSGVATEAGLLLFTDSGQFLARSGFQDPFTSRTVHIDQISRYQSENISKPAFIGSRVYWVTEQGVNSKVWEYIVTSASGGGSFSGSATEITGHVPRYLPRNIYKITGNDNENIVCFFSRDEAETIYVYQYLFSGNNRLQSAWSKWTFDQDIVNGGFIDRNLHLLMDRTDVFHGPSTTLEYLPPRMSDPNIDDSPIADMPVYLDHRSQYTVTDVLHQNPSGLHQLVAGSPAWFDEIVLPYPVPRDPDNTALIHPDMRILMGGTTEYSGNVIVPQPILGLPIVDNAVPNSMFVLVVGDILLNMPLFIGKKYNQELSLSRFVIKTTDRTRTVKPYTSGRTQIRTFTMRFSRSGPFTVTVNNGGTIYSYDYFEPWVLGQTFGPGVSDNNEFKVDVGGRNTETSVSILNDSPFLSNFIGARYEASWNTRSKRI
ncbi:MAG TPA: hypothetical protein EYN51_10755 [Flavobacteriales bacterium]|nr:hypothetical protein [Flavobacteriales bacterium]